jgi:hypothetical protein
VSESEAAASPYPIECQKQDQGKGSMQLTSPHSEDESAAPRHLTEGKGKGKVAVKSKDDACSQNDGEVESASSQIPAKGKGKGKVKGKSKSKAEPPVFFTVLGRLLDGREFTISVCASDTGSVVRRKIAGELDIHASRLKLVAGECEFTDTCTVRSCGLAEGDAINVIILSHIHGAIKRSGLNVPVDVMALKMELHDAMEARGHLRQTMLAAQ